MRGRQPAGPEYFDKRSGSAVAKERAKVVLGTLFGGGRVLAACDQLGIHETRFDQLRERAADAVLSALEPRRAGRPSRSALADADYIRALEQRIEELELALEQAQVREEIALVLPRVQQPAGTAASANHSNHGTTPVAGKKMRRRRVKLHQSR